MKRKTLQPVRDEVENWPGVILRPVRQRNHTVLKVTYGDQSAKLYMSSTASCHRAVLNNISELRKLLRGLGAERTLS